MDETWDKARIEQLIADGVEESTRLEYKAADALKRTDGGRREVTKDVSALANSAGGVIIYGVSEHPEHRHLPGAIDPVDRSAFSAEWLEQVIERVRPVIPGVNVKPVPVGNPNEVVYVVEVPQSSTAHQALTDKYHRRRTTTVVAMEDYEIRDVMGRNVEPRIDPYFELHQGRTLPEELGGAKASAPRTIYTWLDVWHMNVGRVVGKYVAAFVRIPTYAADPSLRQLYKAEYEENVEFFEIPFDNHDGNAHRPILPGLRQPAGSILLSNATANIQRASLHWTVFCDSAEQRQGVVQMSTLVEEARKRG